MNKPTDNRHPIQELLRDRWSPRSFTDRVIEPEKLASLFEAARWSPSGANLQPWSFLFVTSADAESHARLVGTLTDRNQRWASKIPLLILAVARRVGEDGRENPWSHYDLGQSVAHMTVEAVALGLSVHQMGGFDIERARSAFEIPAGYDPVTVIAVGYAGTPDDLPEEFRQQEEAPRTRKEIDSFVFENRWDNPYRTAALELAAETDAARN